MSVTRDQLSLGERERRRDTHVFGNMIALLFLSGTANTSSSPPASPNLLLNSLTSTCFSNTARSTLVSSSLNFCLSSTIFISSHTKNKSFRWATRRSTFF